MVRNGKTCGRPAGWGTDHKGIGRCKNHLGTTRNHRKSADVEKARRSAELLGVPVTTTVFAALQDALDAANGMKRGVEQMVQEAAAGEGDVKLGTALVFYSDAIRELAKTAKIYADAGVEERIAKLQEAQGDRLEASFRLFLANMATQFPDTFTTAVMAAAPKAFAGAYRELMPALEG